MKNWLKALVLGVALTVGAWTQTSAVPIEAVITDIARRDVLSFGSLENALVQIGTRQFHLEVSTKQIIAANMTIPSNITLDFVCTFTECGELSPNSGVTVTINGPLEAPLRQIFGGASTTPVILNDGSVDRVYAIWFGAKGDGTFGVHGSASADSTSAHNKAVNSIPASGGILEYTPGVYDFDGTTTLLFKSNLSVTGPHPSRAWNNKTALQYAGTSDFIDLRTFDKTYLGNLVLRGNDVAATRGLVTGKERNMLENLVVENFGNTATTGIGIEAVGAVGNEFDWAHWRNVLSQSNGTGFLIQNNPANSNQFYDVRASGNSSDGFRLSGANALSFHGLDSSANGGFGVNIISGDGIHIYGAWIEGNTSGPINYPVGSASARNIYVWGVMDAGLGNNFNNETGFTYFNSDPRRATADDPSMFTRLALNRLDMFTTQNQFEPVIGYTTGNLEIGPGGGSHGKIFNVRTASLAPAATTNLSTLLNSTEGLLIVRPSVDRGDFALFSIQGADNNVIEALDPASIFSVTQGTANSINVFWDGISLAYKIENNRVGLTQSFSLTLIE